MKTLFLAFVVVACGGNSTENAAPASPSSPSSSSGPSSTSAPAAGGEGADCGDDVAIQKKCAAGLVCSPKPNAPVSEHTPGVCKKP